MAESGYTVCLERVDKALGRVKRIDGLTLYTEPGKIYGLLGPNGAGKTTIFNLITGLYRPDSGRIRVCGLDPVWDYKETRRQIGLLPQSTALYPELSARENLRFHAALYMPKGSRGVERRIDEILSLVDLSGRADEPVKNYSGGMCRRLGIGRALLNDPQILLLDEPTLGVDVQSTHRIYEYILGLKAADKTIITATNVMAEADALCDEVIIIDRGRKVCEGRPADLKAALGTGTIRLTLKGGIPAGIIRERVGDFTEDGGAVVIRAPGGEKDLAEVLERLKGAIEIESVSLMKPGLDDVFLHHTGKSLRD